MKHYSNTNNPIDFPNIKAGADIHAGDGGYSIGNEEGYKKMVCQRSEALVISLVGKNLSDQWWNGYNKAFEMTPKEKWQQDFRVVYQYLMGHAGL